MLLCLEELLIQSILDFPAMDPVDVTDLLGFLISL